MVGQTSALETGLTDPEQRDQPWRDVWDSGGPKLKIFRLVFEVLVVWQNYYPLTDKEVSPSEGGLVG